MIFYKIVEKLSIAVSLGEFGYAQISRANEFSMEKSVPPACERGVLKSFSKLLQKKTRVCYFKQRVLQAILSEQAKNNDREKF